MEKKQVKIGDLMINYKTFGQGKPVLVLHGWGVGSDSWVEAAKILADDGFKVICPDMPGFGKSAMPDKSWEFDDYIDWIEKFVKDMRLDKFVLIGHSFGGALSFKFCALHPEMVEKLVLCDAAVIRRARLGLRQKFARFLAGNKKMAGNIPFGIYPVLRKIVYKIGGSKDYALAQGVMAKTFQNVVKYDTLEYARIIKTPTLIVWGDKDKETPLSDAYEISHQLINSKLITIPGAGHKPHRTHLQELAQIIEAFLVHNTKS